VADLDSDDDDDDAAPVAVELGVAVTGSTFAGRRT